MKFGEISKMADFFGRCRFRLICVLAGFVRLLFMLYGEWQDRRMIVKYTDIDYEVFTDAARHITHGNSPYKRITYRYTPVLAWLLVPNITIHKAFGKLLFIFCDLCAGFLIYLILKEQNSRNKNIALKYSLLWLFNPLIIVVSTRGNAESLLAVLVLSTLYFMMRKQVTLSAVMLACCVHFKLYPIIYALPLYLTVGWFARVKNGFSERAPNGVWSLRHYLGHVEQIKFAATSSMTFFAINYVMYYIYGYEFLEHSYFYHVTRKDIKHNFSVYFYLLYLSMESSYSWFVSLLAFLPQLISVAVFGCRHYKDLPFCCFLQTFAFVTFNKVCTSQYFLWYLSLFPLIIPRVYLSWKTFLQMSSGWFVAQGVWLTFAYLLEFQGLNTFLFIWLASIAFFLINIWILYTLVRSYHNDLGSDKKE